MQSLAFGKLRCANASLLAVAFLLMIVPGLSGPVLAAGQIAAPVDRVKQLTTLFNEYWQDQLKDTPEFASSIGDKRYNDILSDDSVAAINHRLGRDLDLLQRFTAISDDGLPAEVVLSPPVGNA